MKLFTALVLLATAASCATSPLGRKQLMLVPDSQMNAMGVQAFQELKSTTPAETDPRVNQYVTCVVKPILDASVHQVDRTQWEVVVFKDDSANAFALPGGKIGVYTGLLKVAKTDAQLGAVVGHEVGHVIAKHGGERVSEALAAQGGLAIVDAFVLGQDVGTQNRQLIMGALGVGAQLGLLLPHSRTQEREADVIGLDLMARAGFDPRQSIELWKNMGATGGAQPPEFLSTHPSHGTRTENLRSHMADAVVQYNKAKASGRAPKCSPPT